MSLLRLWQIAFFTLLCSCTGYFDIETRTPSPAAAEEPTDEAAAEDKLAAKLTAKDCVDPDLSEVKAGVKLMLCNGKMAEGTYQAPDLSGLAGNLKAGVSIAGVTGTYTGTYPDATEVENGVQYGPTGTDYTGTKREIKLCKNGKGYVAGVAEGTNYDDGEANGNDSVDDYQNGYGTWNTAADRSNCNETNFTDVSATIIPDDSKRSDISTTLNIDTDGDPDTGPGSIQWTKVFQDDLTGLYFTNVLANDNGTTDMTWSQSLNYCNGLNGGTAGSGWRLPTQKELMQLHIDGIAKLTTFGNTNQYFWSSSSVSLNTTYGWLVYLSYGGTSIDGKTNTRAVVCVRE